MKKLLVTGGAGFIGSEFVRQGVKSGCRIILIDNLTYAGDMERLKGVEGKIAFSKGDVCDKEFVEGIFKRERPDNVIHFAAETHVDRSISDACPFLDTNVKGTYILLDAARRYNVERFINVSTDEVYGELGEDGSFTETTPLNPNSPYSVSKASQDMLGRAYHRTYGLPVITVRPSNNYGPWQYPEKLIPVIIIKALKGEKVPVYGAGQNVREWLYVSDCALGMFSILEKGKVGEIYNIGSGMERKNIDVVRTILGIMKKSEECIEFVKDRPGHDYRYSLDSKKLNEEIGFRCRVSFEEGIEKTVGWYIDNIEWNRNKPSFKLQV